MKCRDLLNLCSVYKGDNPRACGQLCKSSAYGDDLVPRNLKAASFFKKYARERLPILRDGYPEYWSYSIGPAGRRNFGWYMIHRAEVHPNR